MSVYRDSWVGDTSASTRFFRSVARNSTGGGIFSDPQVSYQPFQRPKSILPKNTRFDESQSSPPVDFDTFDESLIPRSPPPIDSDTLRARTIPLNRVFSSQPNAPQKFVPPPMQSSWIPEAPTYSNTPSSETTAPLNIQHVIPVLATTAATSVSAMAGALKSVSDSIGLTKKSTSGAQQPQVSPDKIVAAIASSAPPTSSVMETIKSIPQAIGDAVQAANAPNAKQGGARRRYRKPSLPALRRSTPFGTR